MKIIKIGIIRETKIPVDRRAPLTPENCVELLRLYPNLDIVVQPSKIRVYLDEEYKALKIALSEDLSDCDYILGIKEILPAELLYGMTYLFFSHTIKKQEANRKLLKTIIRQHCTLIDYEVIRDEWNKRLISFGHIAGIVGCYNTIRTYGRRYKLFDLKPAYLCQNYEELLKNLDDLEFGSVKIVVTGGGRVASGALQILNYMKVKSVSAADFIHCEYPYPVYCNVHVDDYMIHNHGIAFNKKDFYRNPSEYHSDFMKFARQADVLMVCAYWNPEAPKLVSKEEMRDENFRIKVIGDITCDVNGSVPSTLKSSSIENPVYDYNPVTQDPEVPYSDNDNITVMAIDNLPCELARDASENFGRQLIDILFPLLLDEVKNSIIENATIAKDGALTRAFEYLEEYIRD